MSDSSATMQNVSDTARWAAVFRARETERPDALFRDPFARRLAGERGFEMTANLRDGNQHAWAWTARTYAFDQYLTREIEKGADMVLNLAAGLDARPYRMALPATLQWVEADLPGILTYKEEILAAEKPSCMLERIHIDLSDATARRALFAEMQRRARRVVVLTEGLVIYFAREDVAALAEDLASGESFARWIVDIPSPGLPSHPSTCHARRRPRRAIPVRSAGRTGVFRDPWMGGRGSERNAENCGTVWKAAVLSAVAGAVAGIQRHARRTAVVRRVFAGE